MKITFNTEANHEVTIAVDYKNKDGVLLSVDGDPNYSLSIAELEEMVKVARYVDAHRKQSKEDVVKSTLEPVRKAFLAGSLTLIEAVKEVRRVLMQMNDPRGTLAGSKHIVESWGGEKF